MSRLRSAALSPATGAAAPDAASIRRPAAAARDPQASLDLAQALDLAARGNRRIAEAEKQLQATAERVADVRGRFLPATTAQARYTWYSSAQTTNVELPAGAAAARHGDPRGQDPRRRGRDRQCQRLLPARLHRRAAAHARGGAGRATGASGRGCGRRRSTSSSRWCRATSSCSRRAVCARVTEQTIALYRSQVGDRAEPLRPGPPHQERSADRAGRAADRRAEPARARPRHRAGALVVQPGDRRRGERPRRTSPTSPRRPTCRRWPTRSSVPTSTTRSCCRSSRSSSASRRPSRRSSAAACPASARAARWTTRAATS